MVVNLWLEEIGVRRVHVHMLALLLAKLSLLLLTLHSLALAVRPSIDAVLQATPQLAISYTGPVFRRVDLLGQVSMCLC